MFTGVIISKEVSVTTDQFFSFLVLSKNVNFILISYLAFIFLLLLFFSYAQLCHPFCVVFMPELQEAFPMLTFIYLLGGVSVDLKADTHQIRKLRIQKTEAKQFEPETQLMYLDLIRAFDTVPQKILLEKLIQICLDLRTFTCFENELKVVGL